MYVHVVIMRGSRHIVGVGETRDAANTIITERCREGRHWRAEFDIWQTPFTTQAMANATKGKHATGQHSV